ncbi:maleylpyruvate isomerase family mycothiol-dependent enzyme [Actinomadura napierensis]|uniref:TIGR03086 family metal-binding protein n=1 Tax=Actinomadura napierensis TaxID=267854 RepID=A0ABN3A2S5_9ACTN
MPTGPTALLEGAISYGLRSMEAVAPGLLSRPTPCADWDLNTLLLHLNESVSVLSHGIASGCVDLDPARVDEAAELGNVAEAGSMPGNDGDQGGGGDPATHLVVAFQKGVRCLRKAWAEKCADSIDVAGERMPTGFMAITSAVEITVHGWDILAACGSRHPIPKGLAFDLLMLCPLLVDGAPRHPMFAAPVPVSRVASPSDRLVAFLGRDPRFSG